MLNKMLMRPMCSDTDVYSVYESHETESYIRHAQFKRAKAMSELCNHKAIEAWIDDNKSKAESDYDDSEVENPESFRTILEYVRDHLDYIFLHNYITTKNQGPW